MILHHPCIITPRLMAGLHLGGAFISIEPDAPADRGRVAFRYAIDLDGQSYEAADLTAVRPDLQQALASLLNFLYAAGEAHRSPGSDNRDLFPEWVAEWARLNMDELAEIGWQLEEDPGIIEP
jgi:hypothetical protein